jgi:hypothetical protein
MGNGFPANDFVRRRFFEMSRSCRVGTSDFDFSNGFGFCSAGIGLFFPFHKSNWSSRFKKRQTSMNDRRWLETVNDVILKPSSRRID